MDNTNRSEVEASEVICICHVVQKSEENTQAGIWQSRMTACFSKGFGTSWKRPDFI